MEDSEASRPFERPELTTVNRSAPIVKKQYDQNDENEEVNGGPKRTTNLIIRKV
jgi:hypothetical protein